MKTPYATLKHHFDKLLIGGYPNNSNLDPIRDTYTYAFDRPINLFDVYTSHFRGISSHNPISALVTLVGPKDEIELGVPEGIMECNGEIVSVNIFSRDIFKGFSKDIDKEYYIRNVYDSMNKIVEMDVFFRNSSFSRNNPYSLFVRCLPFYFTFHHIQDCVPNEIDNKIFKELIEKYITTGDDADILLSSVMSRKYSENIDDIISTMTAKNKIFLSF